MEMIGRAAERQRQTHRGEAGQEHVELAGIFSGEIARQQTVGGVVDAQPRLDAGKIVAGGAERLQGMEQLVVLRPVLGVIDHGEGAAREWQRDVERFRFGARSRGRNRDHGYWQAGLARGDRGAGLFVVGFDSENDVELLHRIIEFLDRRQQAVHRRRLAIQGANHRIDRQGLVFDDGCRRRRWPAHKGADQPQSEPGHEDRGEGDFKSVRRDMRRPDKTGGCQRHDHGQGNKIAGVEARRRRQHRTLPPQRLGGVRRDPFAGAAQDETGKAFGTGEAEAFLHARRFADQADDLAHRRAARGDDDHDAVVGGQGQKPG